jgi:hypothetical protein
VFSARVGAESYCEWCKTPFAFAGAGWAHRTRYCCKECAHEADLERRRQTYVSLRPSVEFDEWHICQRCGETFMPGRCGALYCSTRCRVAAHRAKRRVADEDNGTNVVDSIRKPDHA